MQRRNIVLLTILVLLLAAVVGVWCLPRHADAPVAPQRVSFGVSEGLQLVSLTDSQGAVYVVADSRGRELFPVTLRGCLLDTRYRGGRLRFREKSTGREGYVNRRGQVLFTDVEPSVSTPADVGADASFESLAAGTVKTSVRKPRGERIATVDLKTMAQSNPFYKEAAKVLQGKFDETDAARRHLILNYCEHFRTAYTTKDLDFLRQVFSDDALIIVGHVVSARTDDKTVPAADNRVSLALHTKADYLKRLAAVFARNKHLDVLFSDFKIMRHPTVNGIYGVRLRQRYRSDNYQDDGYLFLLWDFRNPSMPVIHVRTWQPSNSVAGADDVIGLSDFNLQ